jgi:hypothetical protein
MPTVMTATAVNGIVPVCPNATGRWPCALARSVCASCSAGPGSLQRRSSSSIARTSAHRCRASSLGCAPPASNRSTSGESNRHYGWLDSAWRRRPAASASSGRRFARSRPIPTRGMLLATWRRVGRSTPLPLFLAGAAYGSSQAPRLPANGARPAPVPSLRLVGRAEAWPQPPSPRL